MPSFGRTSRERLHTLHPQLRELCIAVVQHTDCTILCGHRDRAAQTLAVAQKRSKADYPNSRHNALPSEAVDLAPWPIPVSWGANDHRELVRFYELAAVVRHEAHRLGIAIRWGGDWDGDGDYTDQRFDDLVHFELLHDTPNTLITHQEPACLPSPHA